MYQIMINRQAKKKLISLSNPIRIRIAEHIHRLGCDPDDLSLDIKKMKGVSGYRLRVGQWRVIFDRNDEIKVIAMQKIGARGDIYK